MTSAMIFESTELVMTCSFHADFKLWKFSADGTEFFQKQIDTVNGIRKLEGFSNKFASSEVIAVSQPR